MAYNNTRRNSLPYAHLSLLLPTAFEKWFADSGCTCDNQLIYIWWHYTNIMTWTFNLTLIVTITCTVFANLNIDVLRYIWIIGYPGYNIKRIRLWFGYVTVVLRGELCNSITATAARRAMYSLIHKHTHTHSEEFSSENRLLGFDC